MLARNSSQHELTLQQRFTSPLPGANENLLIFADNRDALPALLAQYKGKIKSVYIDPPFNTGATFAHYADDLAHAQWLAQMRQTLRLILPLLREDGFLTIQLDDHESAYCKLLLDELMGRENYLNQITVATNKPFGFKATGDHLFRQANHLLLYAKNRKIAQLNPVFTQKPYDPAYKWIFTNDECSQWQNLAKTFARAQGYKSAREAKKHLGVLYASLLATYASTHAARVFRTASVTGGALLKRAATIALSKTRKKEILRHPGDDQDYRFIGGERVLLYSDRLRALDGTLQPAQPLTDIWMDISVEGLASEGGVAFAKGKKPERLLERILSLTTNPGDRVLDCFAGSGTTGAVAHKMQRNWIMIEQGAHCHTHILPRMEAVLNGKDKGRLASLLGWQGGGGFDYHHLTAARASLQG